MTIECANALYRYFKGLYELNQNIIILCGVDVLDIDSQYEDQIENVIHLVPKLVPYVYDKKKHLYLIKKKDGLLDFSNEMPFLEKYYLNVLQNHTNFLVNVKTIRNKLEHRMHGAKVIASGSGSLCLFDITYEINGEKITITAGELIAFVKEMNILFSKIQNLVNQYAYEHNKCNYPYYRRLVRYSFEDFNKIYESDLLRIFGKSLKQF